MDYKSLSSFALSEQLSDFSLTLSGESQPSKLSAHRLLLAANSPLFFKLFAEDPKIEGVALPVPVNSVSGQTTKEFFENTLKFIYGEQTLESLRQLSQRKQRLSILFRLDFARFHHGLKNRFGLHRGQGLRGLELAAEFARSDQVRPAALGLQAGPENSTGNETDSGER